MANVQATGRSRTTGAILATAALLACLSATSHAAAPERPRAYVDTSFPSVSGRTLTVRQGGDLQGALNDARTGDVIELEAGATFAGPFVLPAKAGTGWIVIRTGAADSRLPPPGTRVTPAFATLMPKLEAGADHVIAAAPGAHHYRFVGIEIRPGAQAGGGSAVKRSLRRLMSLVRPSPALASAKGTAFLFNLVSLGSFAASAEALPHHIVFDRCYLHGDPQIGARRGLAMNGMHLAVVDSHLSDFKEIGADSQAILVWNGPGPYKIANNYLEAAGENVMFGGATPLIPDLVPADIEIRGNRFSKPLAWRIGDPAYQGRPWAVKNLFELKNARRVLVDGNLFERNWPHAQNGYAVLFTVRNEDGAVPWAAVEDVTFVNNVVRDVANGFNVLGHDDNPHPSRGTRRVLVGNNLLERIGAPLGEGVLLQLLNGTVDFQFSNNIALQSGSLIKGGDSAAHTGFVFVKNVVQHAGSGITGSGTQPGADTLARYFPGAVIRDNVIGGAPSGLYPPGNVLTPSLDPDDLDEAPSADEQFAGVRDDRFVRDLGGSLGPGVDDIPDLGGSDDDNDSGGLPPSFVGAGVDFGALCAALNVARPSPTDGLSYCPAGVPPVDPVPPPEPEPPPAVEPPEDRESRCTPAMRSAGRCGDIRVR